MASLVSLASLLSVFLIFMPQNIFADQLKNFKNLVLNNGFLLLEYNIVTEDGYILALHRVVTTDFNEKSYKEFRKPVLLQHGLSGASNNFFLNSAPNANFSAPDCGNNFGFCLLASGRYDVWAGNSRANGYSDGQVSNHSTRLPYWGFSFEQMARYDLSATIDFIQQTTDCDQIAYVGHSQAASSIFGLLVSDFGERFHNIIQPCVVWGPAIYFRDLTSILTLLRPATFVLDFPTKAPLNDYFDYLTGRFCQKFPGAKNHICPTVVEQIWGKSSSIDWSRLPEFLKYTPNPISTWTILHFYQIAMNDSFRHFDYGELLNMNFYGQRTPPLYELDRFPQQINLKLFGGATDGFIQAANMQRLWKEIDPERTHSEMEIIAANGYWNHLDFIFSSQAGKLLYRPTLDYLNKFY